MEMKYQIFCETCGKLIPKKSERWPRYLTKKYCSLECRDVLRRNGKMVRCQVCGKEVYRSQYQLGLHENTTCSYKCLREFNQTRLIKTNHVSKTVRCCFCGKEKKVTAGELKLYKNWFCDTECHNKFQVIDKVEYKCEKCGKSFLGQRSHVFKYCSRECYAESMKTGQEFACVVCGASFYRTNKQSARDGEKYCSYKCAQRAPKTIERLLQNRREMSSATRNNLERYGEAVLSEMGIQFDSQVAIGSYVADILIKDRAVIIELDGDYWHGNPAVFTEFDKTQTKTINRDARKLKYFKEHGYQVLRFWESDVYNKTDAVKEIIHNAVCG